MSSTFTAVDLSQLPPPDVIEALSFETILAEMLADLQAREPAFTALVESDPAYKILEVAAYRELLVRQRVNDACRATMLGYATGADLEQIGALYGVTRLHTVTHTDKLIITGTTSPNIAGTYLRAGTDSFGQGVYSTDGKFLPFEGTTPYPGQWVSVRSDGGDWLATVFVDGVATGEYWVGAREGWDIPPTPADAFWDGSVGFGGPFGGASGFPIMTIEPGQDIVFIESDTALRRRIQLALEGFSTAGPEGAYVFHGLSASAEALDISATSPEPGQVLITVLSQLDDGTPGSTLLGDVAAALNDDSVRPLTDEVIVQPAEIVPFTVSAVLHVFNGPDSSPIVAKATTALNAYLASVRKLGYDISLSGVYAALHQAGVQRVELIEPSADIVITPLQAGYCTDIVVTATATDE